jgi:hypothetical protein
VELHLALAAGHADIVEASEDAIDGVGDHAWFSGAELAREGDGLLWRK